MALGHYGAQVRKLKRSFAKRRAVMNETLEKHGLFDTSAANFGGTSFWIAGPAGLDADQLAIKAAEKSVLIDPGSRFFGKPDAPTNYFRVSYSSIDSDLIEDGIAILADTINELV